MAKSFKKLSSEQVGQMSLLSVLDRVDCTPEQRDFIEMDEKKSCLLIATAGSGKTFSVIQRMKELLSRGVPPEKMIFFSYTKAATEELQHRIGRNDVKVTTIHALSKGIRTRAMGKRDVVDFFDFINWFKEKYRPNKTTSKESRVEFHSNISNMYDDESYLSSAISSYKLQSADDIKVPVPDYFFEYTKFLIETKSIDFADMLIDVRNLLRIDKWLKMFRGKYDYIFVDEYQDTSSIQMQILLSLNAKYYYLIGDRNQSIYAYSGANCRKIEAMLKSRRDVVEKTLTVNFRSDISIVQNSNRFSSLKAVPKSQKEGFVKRYIIHKIESPKLQNGEKTFIDLISVLDSYDEVVVLVRTNSVIRNMEFELLKRKYPMRYFNYISEKDIKSYRDGEIHDFLRKKVDEISNYFDGCVESVFKFIEDNKNSKKSITSIHKSKGKEYDYCVVVNSIPPDLLIETGLSKELSPKQISRLSFDPKDEDDVDARNIHYVAVSRARHGLFFMIYDF